MLTECRLKSQQKRCMDKMLTKYIYKIYEMRGIIYVFTRNRKGNV